MIEHAALALAAIGVMSLACQWIAWWVKLPAILFLLLCGILVGPVLGWLAPDELFGELLFPIVSLSVAVILFEGSLTLRFREIRGLGRVVRNMVTVGLLVTWAVTAVAAHFALGWNWELAILFGALTVVTGPTVIIPMLRTVRPKPAVANVLRWEGIVIDPIGALLAVLVFEFIISGRGSGALSHTLVSFAEIIAVGLALGAAGGYLLGTILRRRWLPDYLHNVATLAIVLGVFAVSNEIQDESGLLTVTVMGMWLANMRDVPVDDILDFKESLSVLLVSGLFIILAARIEFAQLHLLGASALVVFLAMQFVARPLKVMVSTWGSSVKRNERLLLAWIAPRGIVAAAIAAVFALRLQQTDAGSTGQQAELLVPMTFLVIIGTVTLQSATARPLARWLGVAEAESNGVLVIGANAVARKIALALKEHGFAVQLADPNYDDASEAHRAGLPTYHGNPISEHADRRLDLVGLGNMLGLSRNRQLNLAAAMRYRSEFGDDAIYTVQTSAEKSAEEKDKVAGERRGGVLFGEDVTIEKLSSLVAQGAEIRSTPLAADLDFETWRTRYGRKALPLFALTPRGQLRIFVAGAEPSPSEGWTVVSLVPAEALESIDATAPEKETSQ